MYEVIVGNIGSVFRGNQSKEAGQAFREYKEQSKTNYGRAAGEDVIMMINGHPSKEFIGSIHRMEMKEDA